MLIHGSWHNEKLWEPVASRLRDRGYRVVVPTVPIERAADGATEHARFIADACASVEKPIIVGHASAGLDLPLVPGIIDVKALVYVNPLLPRIGASAQTEATEEGFIHRFNIGRVFDREARNVWEDYDVYRARLAADVDEAVTAAFWRELRPQGRTVFSEMTPLTSWPDVTNVAVLYVDDEELPVDWMRRRMRESLGTEPIELPGSHLGFVANPDLFVEAVTGALGLPA